MMRHITTCLFLIAIVASEATAAPPIVMVTSLVAQPGNPFAQPGARATADQSPPAGAAPNPFEKKAAPKSSTTLGEPKPAENKPAVTKPIDPPAPAPSAPAEVVVGTDWNVVPDPATTPVAGVAPAAIAAPGSPASSDVRRERTRYRVVVPALPSAIVGLGLNEKEADARDVWDLAANRKIGTVKGLALEGSRLMALSPDGMLFAAKPQFDDFVVVVNVATGQKLKPIPLGGLRLDLLAFSAANRLVMAEDGRVVVHSLPDGRRIQEIPVEKWSVRDGWTLSPGGKYLAAVLRESADRNLVSFVDLTNGGLAGTCRLLGAAGDALGISISRDGKRLATVVDEGNGINVIQVEIAGPKRVPDFKALASDVLGDDGYQGPVVEWLPDGKHLIVAGRLVIDTGRSEVARTLPPPPVSPLVSVGPGVTLAFNGRDLAELPLNLVIDSAAAPVVTPLPATPAAPIVGPPVAPGDRSSVAAKTIPQGGRWDVRLAAPPSVSDKVDTNGFRIPGGFVHQVLLTAATPPIVAVSYAAAPLNEGASSDTAAWVETFDLTTGNGRARVDFPFPTVAVSVSPDAKRLATLSQDVSGRVDIWSLEDDKHLGGCQPAGQRPDRQLPWFVEFVDGEHLLIAVADELSLWEVPAWKQVYTLPIGTVRPALSPARGHVLVSVPNENRVAVVETLTGEVRGNIPTSSVPGDKPLAAAFHHRGRWAAVLSGGAGGGELSVVETDSGRETSRIRIPVSGEVLQFCDDDHLLIDGEVLVSQAKQRVVWRYQLNTGMHCRDGLGGFHWYVSAINPSDKSYIVYGASLPEDLAKREIQSSSKTANLAMRPSDPIKVDVVATDLLTGPHIVNRIRETFTKRYADAGMAISETSPFSLVIDPGRMGVLRTAVWKVSLAQAGQTLWTSWVQGTPDGALLLSAEPPGTETRFADPPEVRTALAGLLQIEPPKYAFGRGAAMGDGTSMLTTSGPRPPR